MCTRKHNTQFIGWFLAGASVAAIATLLLAPQSGKDTRSDIKAAADDVRNKAQNAMREARFMCTKTSRQGVEEFDGGSYWV